MKIVLVLLAILIASCWTLTQEEKKRISDIGWWGVAPPGKHHPFYDIGEP
jgi:hypothetical protein